MKVEKIDHIHFKVNDMKKAVPIYEGLMGKNFPIVDYDMTSDYGLRISFNPFPIGFELMEVSDKSKEMAKLYAAAPEGVFALSLKVPDIDKATAEMESMGLKLLMRYDFGQIKEALFDSKKAVGVFLELIEYPGESVS